MTPTVDEWVVPYPQEYTRPTCICCTHVTGGTGRVDCCGNDCMAYRHSAGSNWKATLEAAYMRLTRADVPYEVRRLLWEAPDLRRMPPEVQRMYGA